MAASFTSGGGTTTVNFTYTTTTVKMQATIFGAAEYIWNMVQGKPDFSSLTTQQKLDVVDAYIKSDIIEKSQHQYIEAAGKTAQAQAQTEAATNYGLG